MTICAWCHALQKPAKRTYFFDDTSSHGTCPACAIKLLSSRPRALIKFLVTHMDELEKLPPPKGFVLVGNIQTSITSYQQLLLILRDG